MTPLPNNHYAVTVPKGATEFEVVKIDDEIILKNNKGNWMPILPPGSYTIVGLGSELGEETYFEIFGINDMQADYNLQPETTLIIKKNE